ncbi:MAG: riboflavin synthase [Bacteroidota bacterium]|nr:riboflavin synthase [Bacteroidota bacterium]
MFTGIIEELAEVVSLKHDKGNLTITFLSSFTNELKIDQSIAHNGVCLTVVDINGGTYSVIAIQETLQKTNLQYLEIGDKINIERALKLGDRLDGHMVQGHIDQTAKCIKIIKKEGSHIFTFIYKYLGNITVEKGSISVNGVSLTVLNSKEASFSVAIIPYTFNNTTFQNLKVGDYVNLEFDILVKYIRKQKT